MKRFNYKATDPKTKKIIKGSVQAIDERSAGKLLVEQGYVPESLEEDAGAKNQKVTTKDRITFTRQFATLVGAGLPLSNSLRTVADQAQSKAMKSVIEDILAQVEAGTPLSKAFASHPDVFNNIYLSLIEAGEASGTLDLALKRLANQEEKDAAIMSKIRGAMVYPIITLVVILAVIIFMMVAVVPQVADLYDSLGKELPFLTQLMVDISNFLMNQWWIVLIILGVIGYGIWHFKKTPTGQRVFDKFKLNVPLFGPLFLRLYSARFARTSQILLSTGVAMLDTMEIAGNSMNNMVVKEQIDKAAEKVQAGKPLSESLKDRDYILPLVHQMASIGEQSGKIDEMLGKAAQVYEEELDEKINALSTMIEPILMVIMAGMAGVIVGGVLMPIYSLVNSIG